MKWIIMLAVMFFGKLTEAEFSYTSCIAADGHQRPILVVNRRMPGPDLQVCFQDEIIVNVQNDLGAESTSIHWHGLHQKNTQYMDGVPTVSQCPIPPGTTFRYHFFATQPGTHFWHSHTGVQRSDGLYGPLIIRQAPQAETHLFLYDFDLPEHIVIVSDWIRDISVSTYSMHFHSNGSNHPTNILVNGMGADDQVADGMPTTPLEEFQVEKGFRYRFRVISNGGLNCPFQMSLDNHSLLIIASDGAPLAARAVDSLILYAGERYDVVISANQTPAVYRFKFKGLIDCGTTAGKICQTALLRYKGVDPGRIPEETTYESCGREGLVFNPMNAGPGQEDSSLTVVEMDSLVPDDACSRKEADFKIFLPYDYKEINNPHIYDKKYFPIQKDNPKRYTPQFNHISMKMPPVPLLSQLEEIPRSSFCNHLSLRERNCTAEFCECTYVIELPLGAVVELVLIDEGVPFDANHPIHLHGHYFRVMAMHRMGKNVTLEEVKANERKGRIARKLKGAPLKDTVIVPDGGYTVVRFITDNPGFWLLHCHIDFHLEIGMAVIFQVGGREQMPPVPYEFPKCSSWTPDSRHMVDPHGGNSAPFKAPCSVNLAAMLLVLMQL